MNVLDGIKNFLVFINENWTSILVIIGLIVTIIKKTVDYFSKSEEEKIEIAKAQIKEVVLKLISDAEVDYEDWNKAGSIKRSQVISKIYEEYPILSKVADQNALTEWIDSVIDESLKTLREIVSSQAE